jgi:hypothetical protein
MSWFAAHLVLAVELKSGNQRRFPVWENIVLIQAASEEKAFAKAEKRGREEAGDDDGSFRWGGAPARWVFVGVRKVVRCQDSDKRPGDGTEVSYNELQFNSRAEITRFLQGQAVSAQCLDEIESPAKKGSLVNGTKAKQS